MNENADPPELAALLANADHVDEKTAEGTLTLREFAAGALGWRPWWVKFLFHVRGGVARVMGLEHPVTEDVSIRPEDISFARGGKVGFFTVVEAEEDRWILLEASDKHLSGYLAVIVEPLAGGRRRYRAITIVKYRHWTGPVYFNLIRPFHHLIVRCMVHAGARPLSPRTS